MTVVSDLAGTIARVTKERPRLVAAIGTVELMASGAAPSVAMVSGIALTPLPIYRDKGWSGSFIATVAARGLAVNGASVLVVFADQQPVIIGVIGDV